MSVPRQLVFLYFSPFITIWFLNKYLLLSISRWLPFFSHFFFLLFLLFLIFYPINFSSFYFLISSHLISFYYSLFILIYSYFLLISIFLIFSCLFLFTLLLSWFIIYSYFHQWTSTPKQFRIELLSFRGPAFSKRYVRTFPILLIATV